MSAKKKVSIVLSVLLVAVLLFVLLFFATGFGKNISYADDDAFSSYENYALNKTADIEGTKTDKLTDNKIKTSAKLKSRTGSFSIDFDQGITINTVVLNEKGFNIKQFSLYYKDANGEMQFLLKQNTVEDFRSLCFPSVFAYGIEVRVEKSTAIPQILECKVYNVPKKDGEFVVTTYMHTNTIPGADIGETTFDEASMQYYDRIILFGGIAVDLENDGLELTKYYEQEKTGIELSAEKLKQLETKFGKKYSIYATMFGFDMGILSASEERQNKVMQAMVDLTLEYDLEGIDFDWEFPIGKTEFDLFSKFLVKLKDLFKPHGKKISTALYGWSQLFSAEAIAAIDYVNVMGYDQNDYDGDNCSFSGGILQPLNYFLDLGFKKEQLVMGLPFYGTPQVELVPQIGFCDIYTDSYTRFDNYMTCPENGLLYSVNGPQMIYDKTAYCIEKGVAGVFAFRIECDFPVEHKMSLLRAIMEAVGDRSTREVAGL